MDNDRKFEEDRYIADTGKMAFQDVFKKTGLNSQ